MSKNNKLLFILDLDGTILTDYDNMLPETIKTIKKAKKQGHIVALVTGRPYEATIDIYKKLKLDTLLGTVNGNAIYYPKINHNKKMSKVSTAPIKQFLEMENKKKIIVDFAIVIEDTIYSTPGIPDLLDTWYRDRKWKKIDGKNIPPFFQWATFAIKDKDTHHFEKFFAKVNHYAIHKWEVLKDDTLQVYELFDATYTKATAVREIAEHYNIAKENIHVFGDGRNDISMFVDNPNTYAMKNAHEMLKFVATNKLNKTNKENGVGLKIEEILANHNKK